MNKKTTMIKYVETLLEEKSINKETILEVQGESGINFIPINVVIEHIAITTKEEQTQIKSILQKIDFLNGDVIHFFKHLAKAFAI